MADGGEGGGRPSRRNASRAEKAKALLGGLAAARAGGVTRVEQYEYQEEEDVYDALNDEEYAKHVAEKRQQAAGFVEDDDGFGYADIGEEEDWGAGGGVSAGGESGRARAQKRARAQEAAAARKKAAMPQPTERGRISRLLAASARAAPAKRKAAAGVDDSDALLEDILSGLGTDAGDKARVRQQTLERKAKMAAAGSIPIVQPKAAVTAAALTATPPKRGAAAAAARFAKSPSPLKAPAPANGQAMEEPPDGAEPADPPASAPETPAAPAAAEPCAEPAAAQPAPAGDAQPSAAKKARVTFATEAAPTERESAWKAACDAQGASQARAAAAAEEEARVAAATTTANSNDLPLDEDGTLPFYFTDAHEEIFSPGTVYLFGKVPVQRTFVSCCVAVRNLQRCVFVVPRQGMLSTPDIAEAHAALQKQQADGDEAAVKDAKRTLNMALHGASAPFKDELRAALNKAGIDQYKIKFVRRTYCLERDDIPNGEQWVVKLTYPASNNALPSDLKGEHIAAALGTHASAIENLLVKRRIMGPSWLALSNAERVNGIKASWCTLEVDLKDKKDISSKPAKHRAPAPLVVCSVSLRTIVNPRTNASEIAAASLITAGSVRCDTTTPRAEWNTPSYLRQQTLVRRLDGMAFPHGFEKKVSEENSRGMGRVLEACASERALLVMLLAKIEKLDPDVIVGHNVAGFDLEVIMQRMQVNKAPHWSRIGRLRRSKFPKLGAPGSSTFGSGASPALMSCVAGRLLCDTYLGAKELLHEVSYSLKALSETQLGETKQDMPPSEVVKSYEEPAKLVALTESGVKDAWLSLALMFHMNQLPLTRQLTELCGNVWSKTLGGQRAQRIEFLLLHEFHARKHLVPDRLPKSERERVARAAGLKRSGDDDFDMMPPDDIEADIGGGGGTGKKSARRRQKAQYAGGLVLEPKKGLYDDFVIMMDFNSLYPSIIQEYNICFTTVPLARAATEENEEGAAEGPPPLPDADLPPGILPLTIKKLVQRRREVKNLMKNERDQGAYQQLHIRQLALKLTANSMYGCLGFSNSRFYAKPLAMLVTSQGREILQSTVDLVQINMGLDVVYGDTDSIFVHTGKSELQDAYHIGNQIKRESNRRFRLLELEIDGVYKTILLLKKKKYAALKVEPVKGGGYTTSMEMKGLDIVRRDWCPLSKDAGKFVLREVLSGKAREDVVESIHAHLERVKEQMDGGSVPLGKYIITKALTKDPKEYPDARNQPHVQVALRRRAQGRREGTSAGDTVPYIICTAESIAKLEAGQTEGGEDATAAKPKAGGSLAERARHFEEVSKSQGALEVDVEWYKTQQVHPVVSRLVAVIEGTDAARIAHCLGLDSSKFNTATVGASAAADDGMDALFLDDDALYESCDRLDLRPSMESVPSPFPGARAVALGASASGDDRAACARTVEGISAAALANQAALAARRVAREYYDGWLRADDEAVRYRTRNVCSRTEAGAPPGSLPAVQAHQVALLGGADGPRVCRERSESSLFRQLRAWERALDPARAVEALPQEMQAQGRDNLARHRAALDAGSRAVGRVLGASAYNWVSLGSLFPTALFTPAAAGAQVC